MTEIASRKRHGTVGLALVAVLLLVSCQGNPFKTLPEDYGKRVDPETLHSARPLDLSESESDAPEVEGLPPLGGPGAPELEQERLSVSIAEARAWTLENNLDLRVALIDPSIAVTSVSEQEAAFEALFVTTATISDADEGQSVVFPDEFVRPWAVEPGVQIPLRTGGSLGFSIPMEREETFFDGQEPYSADLLFSIRQPLLRNAGRRTATHFIRIAALESQIVEAQTKLEVIRQIAAADRAYWLLHEAQELLDVRREQYEQAQDQLERAQSKFEGGVGPEIEVIRARAGVSRRLNSIITTDLIVRDRERALKRIMNRPDVDVDSKVVLDLVSEPDPIPYRLDAGELIAVALVERVELLELELRLAQDLSTIDFAENQKLPLFVLDYAYRIDGQADKFDRAWDRALDLESDGWRLGIDIEVPLGNEAAESRAHRAILTRIQRLATRSSREQSIKEEVLAALDNLRHAWKRIEAAERNIYFESRNYQGEKDQYQLGRRNSTDVLDAETRLADAKAQRVTAVVDYQVAQIDLAFSTGTLLGHARTSW
jgi:outer membrane protein TolC